MVVHVARELQARGRRPGLVSRGYGARAEDGRRGDEEALLSDLLPGVPHEAAPDRAAAARRLLERGADVVVMDDGFQHRRLHRDLDVVLVDATRPWGLPSPPDGGEPVRALLPRGLLRESPAGLARADALVLTRVDQASEAELAGLEAELARCAPGRPVLRAAHRPARVTSATEVQQPEVLRGRAVELVSGIGNPEAFERTVRALGADVRAHRRFPDHHAYRAEDLVGLGAAGSWILTTAKDRVKLRALRPDVRALEIELELLSGAQVLAALLDALPPGRRLAERRSLHEGLHG